jgi:hypothetical protein
VVAVTQAWAAVGRGINLRQFLFAFLSQTGSRVIFFEATALAQLQANGNAPEQGKGNKGRIWIQQRRAVGTARRWRKIRGTFLLLCFTAQIPAHSNN